MPRANELLDLESRDREAWLAEVQRSALSDGNLRGLLRHEDEPDSYERLAVRWMGLGNVLGSDSVPSGATGLESVRLKGRAVQVYVFVGDELATRSTRKSLEAWIGGRLRAVDE